MQVNSRAAFNGNVRRALTNAVSQLTIIKDGMAPKFDDAIVVLLSAEEKTVISGVITYLQGKIDAVIPHQ